MIDGVVSKLTPPPTGISPEQQQGLSKDLAIKLAALNNKDSLAPIVMMPEGFEALLLLLPWENTDRTPSPETSANSVELKHLFFEYFERGNASASEKIKIEAVKCNNLGLPTHCTILKGNRLVPKHIKDEATSLHLNQLFFGDVVWCYFMVRMGLPDMFGSLIQKYAYDGGLTISNGNKSKDDKSDQIALVLEMLTRQLESGNASKTRDREVTFLQCVGMDTPAGNRLNINTVRNDAFPTHFHQFIRQTCGYYNTSDLKSAIQGLNTGKTSSATLVSIRDNISLLLKTFEPFNYNRNYYNTLNMITYLLSGLSLVYELRQTIGIPPEYDKLHEIIPMAYDILVLNRKSAPTESNRFETHFECAKNARNILLNLEALNYNDDKPGGELEIGLMALESSVQGYRTAYRSLTGIDLALETQPVTLK